MDRVNAADEEKKQERDEGDEEQERQIGQAPFQPVRRNSAGSEQDLVEVENPEPSRDAQQTKPDGCVSEMQNDVIIRWLRLLKSRPGTPAPSKGDRAQAIRFGLRSFPHQTAASSGRLSIFDNSCLICTSRL